MSDVLGQSFNRLNVCPTASWDPQAVTFADNNTIGSYSNTISVTTNNTVFLATQTLNPILIWLEGQTAPSGTLSGNLSNPIGLFVSVTGDVYIDNGGHNGRVEKWTSNATTGVAVMNVSSSCYALFVTSNNTLYCSIAFSHTVIKTVLNSSPSATTIAAGNGTAGSTPHQTGFMFLWGSS
jgi:hypothetical protein